MLYKGPLDSRPSEASEYPSLPLLANKAFDDLGAQQDVAQGSYRQDAREPHPPSFHQSEPDMEVAVGYSGEKHVNMAEREDALYVIGQSIVSRIYKMPVPGDWAQTEMQLRQYLVGELPVELITDDYGKQLRHLDEVDSHNLASYQARLWEDLPRAQGVIFSQFCESSPPTEDDIAMARTVSKIAQDLIKNYVFIYHDETVFGCASPVCEQACDNANQQKKSSCISVEPWIDWSTLNSVTGITLCNGKILCFRRDTTSPRNEYFVQLLISKDCQKFCESCLVHLWDRRAMLWAFVDRPSRNVTVDEDSKIRSRTPSDASTIRPTSIIRYRATSSNSGGPDAE